MKATLIPCKACEELRHVSDYYVYRTGGKEYVTKVCKSCQRSRSKKSAKRAISARGGYSMKPPIRKDSDGMTGNERRAYWATFKARKGCVDCGEKDWQVLEFDHMPGFIKNFTIGEVVKQTGVYSDDEIAAEVEKCEVVCRDCHLKRTVSRRRYPESYRVEEAP